MYTSVRWINDYLDPPATAEEQAELATRAGFPLEEREDVEVSDGADVRQDFEMTSNRGDCVCHVGLAREIAAVSGRTLKHPQAVPTTNGRPAAALVTVTNHEPQRCPLYTARIIRGAKIGPSPAWLADRLRARGDIPRNNVVDATNYVLHELGQPTHVFDLARLAGAAIHIRAAREGEPFLPIGEGEAEVKLVADDLVIADDENAVAIAGVKGGALTAVSSTTTDLLLEAATFDPVGVRDSSRRHNITSDSAYRFERGVHPGQVNDAADRLAALILEIAGGEMFDGVVADGASIPPAPHVSMRATRCRKLLGVSITDEEMVAALGRLEFAPKQDGDVIECTVPTHRLDIEREIDLIEEVGRMYGYDRIPVADAMSIRVAAPQPTELAGRAVADELVGMGFIETSTHSLISAEAAATFLAPGTRALRLLDDGTKAEPALQPSVLPNLLRVRRHNQDHGMDDLRLFESAATFAVTDEGHEERIRLGLLMDVEKEADGLRPIRGVIERLVDVLLGHEASVDVVPVEGAEGATWLAPGAAARANGRFIGRFGRLAPDVGAQFGLDRPVLVGEFGLRPFYDAFPPIAEAHNLPSFPAIERDLSPIVAEAATWARVLETIDRLGLEHLDSVDFVTTFRGKGIGDGQKALTFRLRFRAPDRTLRHEEVDPQTNAVMDAMESSLGAVFRSRTA